MCELKGRGRRNPQSFPVFHGGRLSTLLMVQWFGSRVKRVQTSFCVDADVRCNVLLMSEAHQSRHGD